MKNDSRSSHAKIWLPIAASFALLLLAGTASAQWTNVPNTNTNIYYNAGNVGIGTASPATKLDVAGTTQTQDLAINSGSYSGTLTWGNYSYAAWYMTGSGSSSSIRFKTWDGSSYSDKVTFQNGGNVGIGTASPVTRLDVAGVTQTQDLTINSGGYSGSLTWGNYGYASWYMTGSGTGSSIRFKTWDGAGYSDKVSFQNDGSVGIGTTAPAAGYKLHVNGNTKVTGDLNVTGNISAKFQDLAEWVPSSEKLHAGTVVVLDSTKSNQVIASTQAYDTRVAGVVSDRPGIALGEGGANHVLVATTGRVLVNVDASNGAIHIGDLLVTSDISGRAMKSEPITISNRKLHMPGTLIGKALEPLEKGSGKILVLLSLQ